MQYEQINYTQTWRGWENFSKTIQQLFLNCNLVDTEKHVIMNAWWED